MARKIVYKGVLLDQRSLVLLNGVWYWLLYEHQHDDYVLIHFSETKGLLKLTQQKSPQVARLSLFDAHLTHPDFGQIESIRQFTTSTYALNSIQRKGVANYTTTLVDTPKVITMADIHAKFGKNIVLKLTGGNFDD